MKLHIERDLQLDLISFPATTDSTVMSSTTPGAIDGARTTEPIPWKPPLAASIWHFSHVIHRPTKFYSAF